MSNTDVPIIESVAASPANGLAATHSDPDRPREFPNGMLPDLGELPSDIVRPFVGPIKFDSLGTDHRTAVLDVEDPKSLGIAAAELLVIKPNGDPISDGLWNQAVTFWAGFKGKTPPEEPAAIANMPKLNGLLEAYENNRPAFEEVTGLKGNEAFIEAAGQYAAALSRMVAAPNGDKTDPLSVALERIEDTQEVLLQGARVLDAAGLGQPALNMRMHASSISVAATAFVS